jgi:lipid-binding SYLF domain-containing protein
MMSDTENDLKGSRSYQVLVVISLVSILITLSSLSVKAADEQSLVDKAEMTITNLASENEWFRDHVKDSKAIFIVPEYLKGAFIFGAAGGSGVLLVRDGHNWSQPAFYDMAEGSFGFQFGGSSSEIIIVVRTQRGLESFFTHDFRLGGDLSIAAGPVGAGTGGGGLTADVVSFAKAKGAYAGISVEGALVRIDTESNRLYYGKSVRPTDIVLTDSVFNPGSMGLRLAAKKVGR